MAQIEHKGIIVEIDSELTTVSIQSESACSSCHAKALCGVGESKEKIIQIPTRPWETVNVGDEVTLVLDRTMGHKAVWIAYVLPLIVLMAVLLGFVLAGAGELVAAVSAIAAVGLYYFVVWLFRDRLKNEYIFNIKNK